MDSQFYSRENLSATKRLDVLRAKPITDFATVSDGNHMGVSDKFVDDADGIPYYRGSDIYNLFIEQSSMPMRIDRTTYLTCQMARSHLRKGDVLMSIVGAIIGNLSLVTQEVEAACSCKLAILRPKAIRAELLSVFLSSYFGQVQVQKFKRGAAQTGLILEDFDQLKIPDFSEEFETKVVLVVNSAFEASEGIAKILTKSEEQLLTAIGLKNFSPPLEICNIKSLKESYGSTGRLDAEHYQPKYEALYQALAKNNRVFKLGERLSFNQRGAQPDYAEAGLPVVNSKHVQRGQVNMGDTRFASRPDKTNAVVIQKGDVLMNGTGVGTIGRAAPYLHSEKALPDNHVTVLRTDAMSPICLALYLNSIAGQYQVDQHFKGSSGQIELYPADIANFWCPELDQATQQKIDKLAQQSFTLKAQSERLLNSAKRAVEIAIELDEVAGMAYLAREAEVVIEESRS